MPGAPLGRQNGGPRRPRGRRKSKGCAWVVLAGLAGTLAGAAEAVRSLVT